MRYFIHIVLLLLSFGVAACGAGLGGSASDPAMARASHTYYRECGECHPRPAQDHLDRVGWEQVLPRHHERVGLSPVEWDELLQFLSPATSAQR